MTKTLVYSPRVEAFVRLRSGKIIDLSKDIAGGSVRRVVNEPSTAQLTLNNRNARYTGKLAIMDAIHIKLFKGSKEYPVFTGYLTTVPTYDVYNSTVIIEAQCTLKQIVHTYWDPHAPESITRFVGDVRPLDTKNVHIDPSLFAAQAGELAVGATGSVPEVVAFGISQINKFRYSQASPARLNPETSGQTDCSGFVRYCYQKVASIDIGYSTHDQVTKGTGVSTYSPNVPISESSLLPGDLIIYGTGPSNTTHVDMYIGNSEVLSHGGPGNGPNKRPLHRRQSEWRSVRRHITTPLNVQSSQGWVKPLKTLSVSSPYGYRTHPIYGTSKLHEGVDYVAACNTPVYAARAGVVTKAQFHSNMGNYIELDHGSGLTSRYLHMPHAGFPMVRVGQAVNAGQQIGKVGTTGASTGCHLHFEIRVNGSPKDPVPMLAGAVTSTGTVGAPNVGSYDPGTFWKPNPLFDKRQTYYKEQARAGIDGVRLKGFLNEVCGWPFENILIELFPERITKILQQMDIVEGTKDPEEQLQSIYRLLMGDTFSQNIEQSKETIGGVFTGSEGGGDKIYTQTMYGIGTVVSNMNYSYKSDLFPGDGAYGFATGYKDRSKEKQDAALLSELKSYVANGTGKAVGPLAEKYAKKRIPSKYDAIQQFVHNVNLISKRAPVQNTPAPAVPAQPSTPSLESGIDLFLKGMRETESSGNYQLNAGNVDKWVGRISGAYQMGTKEWNNYGGYPEAYLAPPNVQDAHAKAHFSNFYNKYGSWENAAAYHLYPAYAQDRTKWDLTVPGNAITLNQYVARVMRHMTGTESLDGDISQSAQKLGEVLDQSFYAFFRSAVATNQTVSEESLRLSGEKALMNDESALNFVRLLSLGSLRDFQSDPYGNFTAFYPDYFGWYNPDKPMVKIQDLELRDFKIRATDKVYSHVYVVDGSTYVDLYNTSSPVSDLLMKEAAEGVVTMENPNLLAALLGMKPAQAKQFLNLYGARPYVETHYEILNKAFAKLYGMQLFLARWAGQYNTSCDITFMPELWPGTRAKVADTGVGVYVQSVTHNFSYSSGFTTSFVATCPQELSSGSVIDSATGLWLPGGDNTTVSPSTVNKPGGMTPSIN